MIHYRTHEPQHGSQTTKFKHDSAHPRGMLLDDRGALVDQQRVFAAQDRILSTLLRERAETVSAWVLVAGVLRHFHEFSFALAQWQTGIQLAKAQQRVDGNEFGLGNTGHGCALALLFRRWRDGAFALWFLWCDVVGRLRSRFLRNAVVVIVVVNELGTWLGRGRNRTGDSLQGFINRNTILHHRRHGSLKVTQRKRNKKSREKSTR